MSNPASATPSRPSSAMSEASSMASEKQPDEGSKLRTFLGILKKFLGVADLAAVRFSLPAQLLEPRPNLEYWHYMDRPDAFTAIGDSDDAVGRMLAALRFWYTKDLKYIRGKPCKPYNSVLGEFFRCSWRVADNMPPVLDAAGRKSTDTAGSSVASTNGSVGKMIQADGAAASAAATTRAADPNKEVKEVQVSYLTEQTSHHPPVSAWFADCPEKGISARGIDQLSGKFTGTSIRVVPGNFNEGIFITLARRDNEEYQMTHPAAYLGGLLRGNLSVTVADHCQVICPKTRLKSVLHYVEEGWLGRTQNKMNGVIYKYDPDNDNITELKKVPEKDIVARLEGAWTDKIYYTLAGEKERNVLVDLNPLEQATKTLPPDSAQLPNESMRFWSSLTAAIKGKQFGDANRIKHEIEERQRAKARERDETGTTWVPRFFTDATGVNGRPELNAEGRKVVDMLNRGEYALEENAAMAA